MSPNKLKIVDALKKRGFTGETVPFDLFYHPKDGWYLHCDQAAHVWIGYNIYHVLNSTEKGENDQFL